MILLTGCGPSDEEGSPAPTKLAFEGTIEPKLVGKWTTADGNSKMTLGEDGAMETENVAPGRGKTKSAGQWKVNAAERQLLVQVAGSIIKYEYQVDDKRLKLKQRSTRLDVTYERAP
jgi:hypothetical protein